MTRRLCPWSGAPCCGCCLVPDTGEFPYLQAREYPFPCRAWRGWTRMEAWNEPGTKKAPVPQKKG